MLAMRLRCSVFHGSFPAKSCTATSADASLGTPPPICGSIQAADCAHGIYAVRVIVDGLRYDGVANFGRRPMFDVGTVLLEVFLFDFSADLYGRTIDVAFIEWIRPELKFDSIDDLVQRMDEDSRIARTALAKAPDAYPPVV